MNEDFLQQQELETRVSYTLPRGFVHSYAYQSILLVLPHLCMSRKLERRVSYTNRKGPGTELGDCAPPPRCL
jgi:hypothetical protein